ncbi:MAG TPA: FAD-binding oxidoreductase [Thermomicrobiales bacterium]|nr:FAD-binding oxidoreductase [Thermomicrobiales bacterium]
MDNFAADVVVIGAGIVGCATAWYLARRGASVIVVDRGNVGDEQSSRAWGFVRQQGRDPAELPLMIEGNRIWSRLSEDLDADIEWVQQGNLGLAADEERMERFNGWLPIAREFGLDTRILTRAQILDLVPSMTGSYIGGMFTPGDGHAEPKTATLALARAAERAGARIMTRCAAEGIELTAGSVSAVLTERGPIRTRTIVCAAGANSGRIARMAGLSLPQLVVRATVAETTPAAPVTGIGVWAPGVAFRQRQGGSIYIAGGAQSDYDLTLDSVRYARHFLPNYLKNRRLFQLRVNRALRDDIARLIPGTEARRHPFSVDAGVEPEPNPNTAVQSLLGLHALVPPVENTRIRRLWAGLIDTTPDALPVLGPVDTPKGFVFATGFSGHGFALGPVAGKLVSELILDGQSSIDIYPLTYSRFKEGRAGKPKNVL